MGFEVNQKALNYKYPNLNTKIIKNKKEEMLCVGMRGQLAIEIIDGDGPRNSMRMKIEEIKNDALLTEEGIYQEPLSWNEFRQWVLDNPQVLDDWYDIVYGISNRYQSQDNDIFWEGIIE